MGATVSPTPLTAEHPGRRTLVFGAIFAGAFTIVFHWLMWAFTGDFFYALLPSLAMGGLLFALWAMMSHRVRVETREGHLP